MKSTLFIPISLPITRSSGIKGDRWRLCCIDFSWSLSSSSKLSLGNSSRANEWKWEIDSFSCEQGGVGKIDDGESKQGVRRSRRRLPGVSGDMKQLGSWGMILFFFWSLSVSSMTNKCCSRFTADPKITYVPWSMLLLCGEADAESNFWVNRQNALTTVSQSQPVISSRQNCIMRREAAAFSSRSQMQITFLLRCFMGQIEGFVREETIAFQTKKTEMVLNLNNPISLLCSFLYIVWAFWADQGPCSSVQPILLLDFWSFAALNPFQSSARVQSRAQSPDWGGYSDLFFSRVFLGSLWSLTFLVWTCRLM